MPLAMIPFKKVKLERQDQGFAWVKTIYTLGPSGTNCERAALHWANGYCPKARLNLQPTMEAAAAEATQGHTSVLLSVVAYPELHSIIYANLGRLQLADLFIMNTDEMVLASVTGEDPQTCATHAAPQKLLPANVQRRFVSSNACAASECAEGQVDSCITTALAARKHRLKILRSFGSVPMGFTIHSPCRHPPCAQPHQHCPRSSSSAI